MAKFLTRSKNIYVPQVPHLAFLFWFLSPLHEETDSTRAYSLVNVDGSWYGIRVISFLYHPLDRKNLTTHQIPNFFPQKASHLLGAFKQGTHCKQAHKDLLV